MQHTLAEMARRVEVARVYTRSVAVRAAAGETNLVTEACFAKNTAVEAGSGWSTRPCSCTAGWATCASAEVERQYRDMRILGIGGGTTEILTGLSAKLLGYTSMTDRCKTAVDPSSPEYAANRAALLEQIAALDAEHAKAVAGGGEKYVAPAPRARQAAGPRAHRTAARSGLAVPRAVAARGVGHRLHRRRVGRHRHRRRQRRRVHDQRQRPDGPRRRVQPVDAEEGAARQRDRDARTGCR